MAGRPLSSRLCALGLFIFCLGYTDWASARPAISAVPWLEPAPPFHLQDLDGVFHHLTDFRGRVLIVNFWASWCSPCREELPSMNRAWAELRDEGVAMLAINLGEDREAVSAFTKDFPIDFNVLLDSRGNIGMRWQVTSMPTTFVVSPRGEIVYRIMGSREWDSDQLLQLVRDLK